MQRDSISVGGWPTPAKPLELFAAYNEICTVNSGDALQKRKKRKVEEKERKEKSYSTKKGV